MKRQTYREGKKDWEKEKKHRSSDKHLADQETAEFHVEDFRRGRRKEKRKTYDQLDTNEIFFHKEKEKQWLWSSPQSQWRRLIAVVIVVIAILVVILLLPGLLAFFKQIFHTTDAWF